MNDSNTISELVARVTKLEAKLAIIELLGSYGRALDEYDEQLLRKIIAPDVVAKHDAVAPPLEGIDTFLGIMKSVEPKVDAVQHFITNMEVQILEDGDHAIARALVFAMHDTGVSQPESNGALMSAGASYTMDITRADTEYGWQISKIIVDEKWFDPRILTDIYDMSPMREQ